MSNQLNLVKCGCEHHMVDLRDDKDAVNFEGKWWKLRCLFLKKDGTWAKLVEKYDILERRCDYAESVSKKLTGKMLSMKRMLSKSPCYGCGQPAGNRLRIDGNMIYCGGCFRSVKNCR